MINTPLKSTIEFLSLANRRIAYQRLYAKDGKPSLFFLGGFASDMTGTKASHLAACCAAAGYGCLRFDYTAHGATPGDFRDGTIGSWFDDTLAIFDALTNGPQIVIGSSMGGWLGLKLILARPERVAMFIGVAAAPDFTEELIRPQLTPELLARLEKTGKIDDGHAPITQHLLDEARNHLLLGSSIDIRCPVQLLQGMEDTEVPWRYALRIAEQIAHKDVLITLIKDGDHRLSRDEDLRLLWQCVERAATL